MTIKQLGGVFGRNPTFNDVTIEGELTFDGDIDINSDLKIDGDLVVTGGMTVDSSTLVVDDNANRVGIGTTTPQDLLHITLPSGVNGDIIALGRAANSYQFHLGMTSSSMFYIADNSSDIKVGFPYLGGITFNGDTAAANALDDYEEGSWTSLVGGTATYGANSGRYTKIGRQVFATFDLNITTIGTGSTSVITGLPFPVGDAIAEGVSVNFYSGLANNVVELNAYVINSEIRFRAMSSAGSGLTEIAVLGSGCRVTGTAIYTV